MTNGRHRWFSFCRAGRGDAPSLRDLDAGVARRQPAHRHRACQPLGESVSLAEKLKSRLSLPVIAAPMFIVSNPDLVIAQCTSGVVGSFPALNARPAEQLEVWIETIE